MSVIVHGADARDVRYQGRIDRRLGDGRLCSDGKREQKAQARPQDDNPPVMIFLTAAIARSISSIVL
jgi:hypothetical protein